MYAAPSDSGDLVDHEETVLVEPVLPVSSHSHPHEGCVDFRAREWADRQRVCRIEPVILDDQGWPRLVRIDTACDGGDVTASHSFQSSETASTKPMSSLARSVAATSADCR